MADLYKERIINYFLKNVKKGYSPETLKWALINQGYSKIIVENALEEVTKELAKNAPILEEKPIIRHEILDINDNPIIPKKSWLKRVFG